MKINRIIKCSAILLAITAALAAAGCNKDESSQTAESSSKASSEAKTESKTESKSAESSAEESKKNLAEEESGPIPEISDPAPDSEGETVNGVFIFNNKAYEMFYGSQGMAEYYAQTLSAIKKDLGDSIKVYNVLVPTHVAIDLPSRFDDMCNNQEQYIKYITDAYTEDIIPVSAYNKLMHHRNEYLYFNTDHHWTALGAYYAYLEFTRAAGIEPVQLSDLKEDKIEGYQGSLAAISGVETLTDDYVTYFTSNNSIDTTLYDGDGSNPQDYSLIHSYAEGSNAYGVFLGGDTPILTTKNEKGNGKKIAVIKESYGNAFSPFIAYTYSEAHFIDFRYVSINLKSYLQEHGIDEVIFINNTMASATEVRCDEMKELIGGTYTEGDIDTEDSSMPEEYDYSGIEEPSEDEIDTDDDYTDTSTDDYGTDDNSSSDYTTDEESYYDDDYTFDE